MSNTNVTFVTKIPIVSKPGWIGRVLFGQKSVTTHIPNIQKIAFQADSLEAVVVQTKAMGVDLDTVTEVIWCK